MNDQKSSLIDNDLDSSHPNTAPSQRSHDSKQIQSSLVRTSSEKRRETDNLEVRNSKQTRHIQLSDVGIHSETVADNEESVSDDYFADENSSEMHVSLSRQDPFKQIFSGKFEWIVDHFSSNNDVHLASIIFLSVIEVCLVIFLTF